jgi:hypothetical protein
VSTCGRLVLVHDLKIGDKPAINNRLLKGNAYFICL